MLVPTLQMRKLRFIDIKKLELGLHRSEPKPLSFYYTRLPSVEKIND